MLKVFAVCFAPRVNASVLGFPFFILLALARRLAACSEGVSIVLNCGHILFAKCWISLVNVLVNPRKILRDFSVWSHSFAEACQRTEGLESLSRQIWEITPQSMALHIEAHPQNLGQQIFFILDAEIDECQYKGSGSQKWECHQHPFANAQPSYYPHSLQPWSIWRRGALSCPRNWILLAMADLTSW